MTNLVTACTDCNLGKAAVPLTVPAASFQPQHRVPSRAVLREVSADDGPPLWIPVEEIYAFGPLPRPVSGFTAAFLLAVRQMRGESLSYGVLAQEWGWKRGKVRRSLAARSGDKAVRGQVGA